ncbi:hypothetical protein [Luteipulveratus halotolerans]|uniref:hypothetical protein n=1 Tax=Luteipulveratus halotolerans TaxID=1631356 RepID=UPI0012FB74B6|nr:hypothetical protein [Luteipulveratus halotolerans]
MTDIVRVTSEQVAAARGLIDLRGRDNVPAWYLKIANAKPSRAAHTASAQRAG